MNEILVIISLFSRTIWILNVIKKEDYIEVLVSFLVWKRNLSRPTHLHKMDRRFILWQECKRWFLRPSIGINNRLIYHTSNEISLETLSKN